MSETPENLTSHALLCFEPIPAVAQPAEIEPVSPPSSDANADSPTPHTMGNAQSGEGSLRRKNKKKSKNKDEKGKVGIASALFRDPVVGASGMGAYGGTSVDEAATPNKRKKQAEQPKSPRPIRSTYDNVHQSGSITSLTSDLFLDTVSRLDVSMTTSQGEIGGIRHHIDPQTFDSISYSGMSLAESGFITPALMTPQVQRNQLAGAGAMTNSDSVTELGKEIERTIFERLSANQKLGAAEAQPEASISSSPKSNEIKMTLVMRSPIPPRKTVTEVKSIVASPLTAKLESAEPKPLKPLVESIIELDLRTAQSDREEDIRKPEVSDGTDKADNELMEKDCKPGEKRMDPDNTPEEQIKTKEKHNELDANGPSSSSVKNCGDFEEVKLHIEEEDLLVVTDQKKKITSTCVEVEASSHPDIGAGQSKTIADRKSDHKHTPSVVAAGQQSTLVRQEVPKEEVGEKEIQIKPMDKQQKTGKSTEASVGGRRRRERTKIEAPKEKKVERTRAGNQGEKSESVFKPQAPQVEGSEETASTAATVVAAAAAVVTKPLEQTGRTVELPQAEEKASRVQTRTNVSAVGTPKAACEELIQATEFASVEQAHLIMRRPVFEHDQKIHDNQDLIELVGSIELNPKSNLGPETIDYKNGQKEDEETGELKGKTEEKLKEKTPITPSGQRVSAETDASVTKEQEADKGQSLSDLESGKVAVSTSKTDEIPTTKDIEDPPIKESTTEKSSGEITDKASKSKKDRKRKRKKGKRQSMDASDMTTTAEAEAKVMSEREDASSTKEEDVTVSSKEENEKSTTDDSSDWSSTAFEKHTLQQQTTVIERTGYQRKDTDENLGVAYERLVDACDLFLQSEEFRNQEPCNTEMSEGVRIHKRKEPPRVAIDKNLTVECPTSSEILSDEPTPTNDRWNQMTAFYIPDRSPKSSAKLFYVSDIEQVKLEESKNDSAAQDKQWDDIRWKDDEYPSDSELKLSGSPQTSEEKNNDVNESTDNVVTKDCPDGTNIKTEKRNLRISLTSEEVSEIFENSQTRLDDEAHSNNRPLIHCQDAEDEVKYISNGSDWKEVEDGEEDADDWGHRKKRTKNISNLTLSDIDSSLPETLPELADLQNFLEYIKVGEQPTGGDTPPFSPFFSGENGRSSPNENSNSRRLSRISPAVTERSVTESDLDISEQRDDLSTDSNIFADDEDESSSELLFTKTYTEPDKGGEVCVSCTVVNTNADDDSDEFWAENSATEEVYQRIETSSKAVTTVFDNARLQMQDIHTHLHNLRLQMESLQDSLDNASIISQEYYNMDNDQVTSQEYYSHDKGLLVSQEYFSKSRRAPVTTEEYSPVDIGPVLTEEYYSSALGKPPLL